MGSIIEYQFMGQSRMILGVFHEHEKDSPIVLHGHTIPEGARVLAKSNDAELFVEGERWNYERFEREIYNRCHKITDRE